MSIRQVFVDESKAREYLLVSVALDDAQLRIARRAIRDLRLRGQTRVHMKKESDARRRRILGAICALRPEVVVHRAAKRHRTDLARRSACIGALITGQPIFPTRIVLERDETLVDRDRRTIIEALRERQPRDDLRYEHASASVEPLLAIPDAIAWAWARGGAWRLQLRDLDIAVVEA